MSKKFFIFTVIGVINTIVDISILYLLILIFGNNLVYIPLFNIISYSSGIVSSFILNGKFTFRDTNLTISKFTKLYVLSIGALVINTFAVYILICLRTDIIISKMISAFIVVIYNYIICRKFIYLG